LKIKFKLEKQITMTNKEKAVMLQKELIEKGYNYINICADQEDGIVSILHCALLKEHMEDDYFPGCDMDITYHLSSDKALELLEQWVEQISIYPDPRRL
jgi:hydrogenase maturation factor